MFQDREDAGRQLAKRLEKYRGADALVLALPRGGVVLGAEVARALRLPLDILVTRKIGHPTNPEYAICAVDEKGTLLCDEAERALVNKTWLAEEAKRQQREAQRRVKTYRGGGKPAEIRGKTALIIDDGIATGLTMRLAIKVARAEMPARIVVAVPVAPTDMAEELAREVDEFIVLLPPEEFAGAVGAHYQEFAQVEDETVVRLLRAEKV